MWRPLSGEHAGAGHIQLVLLHNSFFVVQYSSDLGSSTQNLICNCPYTQFFFAVSLTSYFCFKVRVFLAALAALAFPELHIDKRHSMPQGLIRIKRVALGWCACVKFKVVDLSDGRQRRDDLTLYHPI